MSCCVLTSVCFVPLLNHCEYGLKAIYLHWKTIACVYPLLIKQKHFVLKNLTCQSNKYSVRVT